MTANTFEAIHKESFSGEYNLFLPDGYATNNQYPLLVYLHGYYGEYISPNVMTDNIPDGLKENSNKYQFILACPLCPFEFYWRTTYVFSFINHLIETYDVDDRKTFLSGTSMGGFGTWATAHEFPDMFAGIVPVSGGVSEINQYQAHRFQHLPVRAFHNKGDEIVRYSDSERMIASINEQGGNGKLTVYEVDGHDADVTYQNKELYRWLLSL